MPALERSAQILRDAGYDCVLLLEPIGKAWDLLGVSPHGLVLVTVVRGEWPAQTVRLVHRYTDESPWPEVRALN